MRSGQGFNNNLTLCATELVCASTRQRVGKATITRPSLLLRSRQDKSFIGQCENMAVHVEPLYRNLPKAVRSETPRVWVVDQSQPSSAAKSIAPQYTRHAFSAPHSKRESQRIKPTSSTVHLCPPCHVYLHSISQRAPIDPSALAASQRPRTETSSAVTTTGTSSLHSESVFGIFLQSEARRYAPWSS